MKKIWMLVALMVTGIFVFSQSTLYLRADTVRAFKQGDSAYLKADSFLIVTKQAAIGLPYLPFRASALLELNSTSRGFITSRMTAAQRLAIGTPGAANFVWDSDSLRYMGYNGTVWKGLAWTGEAGGGGSTPTLQQVLTAGSTLTTSNTIISGANDFSITGDNSFGFQVSPSAATFQVGFSGTQYDIDAITGVLNAKIAGTSYLTFNQNTSIHNIGRISSTVPHILIDETTDIVTINDAVVKLSDKSTPGTPASTFGYLYVNTDSLRFKNDAGTVFTLGTSGGGGGGYTTLAQFVGESNWKLFYSDGSGDVQELAHGTTGKVLTSNGTSATPSWETPASSVSFEDWYTVTDEMFMNYKSVFHCASGGAGSAAYFYVMADNLPDGWAGAVSLAVGTGSTSSANAGCYITATAGGALSPISLASPVRANIGYKIQIPTLSDGTDTYVFSCGFADAALAPASASNGVYFEYTHSLNSGNWTCTTESGGTKTQTDSGIPVAINTDYELEISVFGGNAYFYINKTLVVTTSTNIPAASAQVGGYSYMYKTAGTTSRSYELDWAKFGTRKN